MIDLDVELPAIQCGDERAFTRWIAGAEIPVRSSLRRYAALVDTEAVMQETLLRIWLVARRCRKDGKPNSLLRLASRIARNIAISEIRRPGLAPAPSGPDVEELVDPAPAFCDPLLRERIKECLARLPGRTAAAIMARLGAGGCEPDKVLAVGLGMRLNTFLQNITRARRLLVDCLAGFGITVPK